MTPGRPARKEEAEGLNKAGTSGLLPHWLLVFFSGMTISSYSDGTMSLFYSAELAAFRMMAGFHQLCIPG